MASPAPIVRIRGRMLAILLVMCGAVFLEGIDVAMFNVALPSIQADIHIQPQQLHWIVGSYLVGYGGFVLLGGRTADVVGRRRTFRVALTAFVVFTFLGGISTEAWMLVAARAATGVAAAFMAAAGLSIVTTALPKGTIRDRAVMIYSGVAAGGFSIGLVLGGLLSTVGWRWVFFAPLLLAVSLLVVSLPSVPRDAGSHGRGKRIDWPGALEVSLALVLLVLAIEQAPNGLLIAIPGLLIVAALLTVVFVRRQKRVPHPLVPLDVLKNASRVRANLSAGLLSAGFLGFQFLLVHYLQEVRGWTALATSLAMLVLGIDVVLSPLVTPFLVRRFGKARVIVAGLAFAVVAYALFLPVAPDWVYAAMLPSFVALGIAFTLAYGPLTIVATEGVVEHDQGLAVGIFYTVFQFGGAIGLSLVSSALAFGSAAGLGAIESCRVAVAVPLGLAVVATLVSATMPQADTRGVR